MNFSPYGSEGFPVAGTQTSVLYPRTRTDTSLATLSTTRWRSDFRVAGGGPKSKSNPRLAHTATSTSTPRPAESIQKHASSRLRVISATGSRDSRARPTPDPGVSGIRAKRDAGRERARLSTVRGRYWRTQVLLRIVAHDELLRDDLNRMRLGSRSEVKGHSMELHPFNPSARGAGPNPATNLQDLPVGACSCGSVSATLDLAH